MSPPEALHPLLEGGRRSAGRRACRGGGGRCRGGGRGTSVQVVPADVLLHQADQGSPGSVGGRLAREHGSLVLGVNQSSDAVHLLHLQVAQPLLHPGQELLLQAADPVLVVLVCGEVLDDGVDDRDDLGDTVRNKAMMNIKVMMILMIMLMAPQQWTPNGCSGPRSPRQSPPAP